MEFHEKTKEEKEREREKVGIGEEVNIQPLMYGFSKSISVESGLRSSFLRDSITFCVCVSEEEREKNDKMLEKLENMINVRIFIFKKLEM